MNKWRKHNVSIKLVEKMNDLNEKIINWDQDVLNSYFNGQYLDLDEELNFNSTNYGPNKSFKILHFIGSKKPWYLRKCLKILLKFIILISQKSQNKDIILFIYGNYLL